MKRWYQLVAVAVVALLVPIAASMPAGAASTCEIGYTGPDSQNMCTSVETYRCSVTNENSVTITNTNNQTVASGSVAVSGNGSGGSSTSGSVTNTSGTTFRVTITNSAPNSNEPGVCTASVVVPATVTPEVVTPEKQVTPEALPVTSGDATLLVVGMGAGLAVLIAGGVTAYALYRRSRIS